MKTEHNGISVGDKVSFKPGPNSPGPVTGTVTKIDSIGSGRGRGPYLFVKCDDGRERKCRPGSATKI